VTDEPSAATPKPGDVSDRGERFAVTVRIDGEALPLKQFLHDMIGGAATGLVAGLRGVEDASTVAIEVRKV
jgi:hypothetical protein